jgi:hypothetical protein
MGEKDKNFLAALQIHWGNEYSGLFKYLCKSVHSPNYNICKLKSGAISYFIHLRRCVYMHANT